mmetsp:Transcript_90986/g.203682  ORF Transcript_90986/g.203682 Transcript_90986/m.203682 type:complete len:213 (+) Transcript_90986:1852-2490(+)
MASIRDRVERRGLVSVVVIDVLGSSGDERHVVVDEVQTAGLAVTGAEGHVVALRVPVGNGIHHLLAVGPQLQPILRGRVLGHLVEPRANSNVLDHDVAGILNRLRSRGVVQAQGGAGGVLRRPIPDVVQVGDGEGELVVVVGQVLRQLLASGIQRGYPRSIEGAPLGLLQQLLQGRLPGKPLYDRGVQGLNLPTDLGEAQNLRLLAPEVREL